VVVRGEVRYGGGRASADGRSRFGWIVL